MRTEQFRTTEFTNFIGWNWYWKLSRFSHLDQHLDWLHFAVKKLQIKMQLYWLFSSNNIYFNGSAKKPDKKKGKENVQTLAKLSSYHCCAQAKCQLVLISYIKRISRSLSVKENLDLGCVSRAHCVLICTHDLGQDFSHTNLLLS